MMKVKISPELDAKVKARIEECRQKVLAHYKVDVNPILVYKNHGRTAGRGGMRGKVPFVSINPILLVENEKEMIRRTVAHEFAHACQYTIWPRGSANKPHGFYWKQVMGVLGVESTRCHSYDTTNSQVRSNLDVGYVYHCNCRRFVFSELINRRMRHEGQTRRCTKCNYGIVPENQTPTPYSPPAKWASATIQFNDTTTFVPVPPPKPVEPFKPTVRTIFDPETMTLRNVEIPA